MFLVVLLDVVQEFLALKNLDVGCEADDEAAGAFDAVDGGLEYLAYIARVETRAKAKCQDKAEYVVLEIAHGLSYADAKVAIIPATGKISCKNCIPLCEI